MKSIVYQKVHMNLFNLIVLFFLVSIFFFPRLCAQDELGLYIEIYDSNTEEEIIDNTIFEGKSYDIVVNAYNETGFILDITGVNVSFLNLSYNTSTEFIRFYAPLLEDYESFVIKAAKNGFLTAELKLTVIKGELSIVIDRSIIEEKKEFQVMVTDQDNQPVEGAYVYIISEDNPVVTNLQGIAYLQAPDVDMVTTASIQVIKSGYSPGSINIRVENAGGYLFNLTELQFLQILPILIAILVVIFASIYVIWRQKRTFSIPYQTTQKEQIDAPKKTQQKRQAQQFKNKPTIFSEREKRGISIPVPESRVEEIRIPVQEKKKETTVLSKEKESKSVSTYEKKEQDDWFKGQNYMRYKIDELTGKIDQTTDGKWFEGEHDIKNIVDETLRKNVKKKKSDEENVK